MSCSHRSWPSSTFTGMFNPMHQWPSPWFHLLRDVQHGFVARTVVLDAEIEIITSDDGSGKALSPLVHHFTMKMAIRYIMVYHGIPICMYIYIYILIDCIISVLDKPKLYRICRYWQGSGKDGKEGWWADSLTGPSTIYAYIIDSEHCPWYTFAEMPDQVNKSWENERHVLNWA